MLHMIQILTILIERIMLTCDVKSQLKNKKIILKNLSIKNNIISIYF